LVLCRETNELGLAQLPCNGKSALHLVCLMASVSLLEKQLL
jgi:hypothetical protein